MSAKEEKKPIASSSSSGSYGTIPKKEHYHTVYKPQKIVITKRDCVLMGIVAAIVVIGVSVTLTLGLPKLREKKLRYEDTTVPISNSKLLSFNKAVVVSDGAPCAKIGRDILEKGGSAVDAAIAALFCGGVVNPQSMGLGGGFIMTIYQRQNKTIDVIDGREMAPLSATVDMFHGNSTLSQSGGLAVAVPGELKGYQLAHQKYGKLNWTDLVTPGIDRLFLRRNKQCLAFTSVRLIDEYIVPSFNT